MEAILSFIQNFLKKTWAFLGFAKNNFWVFLSVPHLVDNYAKIVDGRGRNLMCHRTLPGRLVALSYQLVKTSNTKSKGRKFSVVTISSVDFPNEKSFWLSVCILEKNRKGIWKFFVKSCGPKNYLTHN